MNKIVPLARNKKSTREVISLLKELLIEMQSGRSYPVTGVAIAFVHSDGTVKSRRAGGDLCLLSGALNHLIYSISKEIDEESSCLLD